MSTFPFKAWVLTPDFTPTEVSVVGHRGIVWLTADARSYRKDRAFTTRQLAVKFGRAALDKRALKVHEQVNQIAQLRRNLEK